MITPPHEPRRSPDMVPPAGGPVAVPAGVPGPVDREHFLDAQRRNRRASWRATVLAAFAVALSGIPLCVIVTPALYVPLLVAAHAVDAVADVPAAVWQPLHDAAHLLPIAWAKLRHGTGTVTWRFIALLLVVPGAVVMVPTWVVVRRALRRAWAGDVLRRLHARRPRLDALDERRLVNTVEETAVAAAIAPPRVLVADVASRNALVLDRGGDRATVVVTRGLLEALPRDELQAVAAYLVASAANGDLRIAATFLSVFQAWGALGLLTDSALTPRDRRALRRTARTTWQALRSPAPDRRARAAERQAADALLGRTTTEGGTFAREDSIYAGMQGHPLVGCLVMIPILLTLGVASIVFRAALELSTALVFGPPMAWLWRSRRRLADATAVELTRDPDALARAVRAAVGPRGVTPEAAAFSFLSFVRATHTPQSVHDVPKGAPAVTDFVIGMHPEPEDRLARLQAIGAASAEVPAAARTPVDQPGDLRTVILWGLAALALVVVLMLVNLATTAVLLHVVWRVLTFLLVTVPHWVAGLAR